MYFFFYDIFCIVVDDFRFSHLYTEIIKRCARQNHSFFLHQTAQWLTANLLCFYQEIVFIFIDSLLVDFLFLDGIVLVHSRHRNNPFSISYSCFVEEYRNWENLNENKLKENIERKTSFPLHFPIDNTLCIRWKTNT